MSMNMDETKNDLWLLFLRCANSNGNNFHGDKQGIFVVK